MLPALYVLARSGPDSRTSPLGDGSTATVGTASADTWHRHDYENDFKGMLKYIARGEQVIGHRNPSQVIYGARSYLCYKAPRQTRYSMDILFEDYYSGGGGGGGSW